MNKLYVVKIKYDKNTFFAIYLLVYKLQWKIILLRKRKKKNIMQVIVILILLNQVYYLNFVFYKYEICKLILNFNVVNLSPQQVTQKEQNKRNLRKFVEMHKIARTTNKKYSRKKKKIGKIY